MNFYARLAEGPWRGIGFTSPSPRSTADPRTNPLASCQVEGIKADGQWHHAKLPFVSLPGVEPNKPFLLSALAISNPSDPYLRCGIGGNPLGIAYHLDNFVLHVPE